MQWRTVMQECTISWRRLSPKPRPDAQGEAMKSGKLGAIGICAALTLAVVPALPAQAAVTTVGGTLSCPVGQVVWVSVTTRNSAIAYFYSGSLLRTKDLGGYNHAYNYGTRTVTWRVDSTGDIATSEDWCGGNANSPSA